MKVLPNSSLNSRWNAEIHKIAAAGWNSLSPKSQVFKNRAKLADWCMWIFLRYAILWARLWVTKCFKLRQELRNFQSNEWTKTGFLCDKNNATTVDLLKASCFIFKGAYSYTKRLYFIKFRSVCILLLQLVSQLWNNDTCLLTFHVMSSVLKCKYILPKWKVWEMCFFPLLKDTHEIHLKQGDIWNVQSLHIVVRTDICFFF